MSVGAWPGVLFGAPLMAALWTVLDPDARRARVLSITLAVATCMVAGVFALVPDASVGSGASVAWVVLEPSELGRLLVVLPPALWLVTVVATPSGRLGRAGLTRVAVGAGLGSLAFLTGSATLLACIWAATSGLFLLGISTAENGRARRVIAYYQGASVLLLVGGLAVMETAALDREIGLWLVICAVLVRKGIFPFHAWVPEAFDQGRIGPTVQFCAPQLGSYVAAVLVVPIASPAMLRTVAILSLITAVYGAALALVQTDARRAVGYLFVSQSALVLAGLDCSSEVALTGALVLWIASALAFTGFARAVLALEARRGRQKLTTYHGGFDQVPLLATSFLLFGLACTGFPGTLGFVGQELLIDGAVHSFPALGFFMITASGLTGIAVLRMYLSLFCGRPSAGPGLRLRAREAITFGGLAVMLVASGVLPSRIIESRQRATTEILRRRAAGTSTGPASSSLRHPGAAWRDTPPSTTPS